VGIHLCLKMRFWTGSSEFSEALVGSVITGFCDKKSNGWMTKAIDRLGLELSEGLLINALCLALRCVKGAAYGRLREE